MLFKKKKVKHKNPERAGIWAILLESYSKAGTPK